MHSSAYSIDSHYTFWIFPYIREIYVCISYPFLDFKQYANSWWSLEARYVRILSCKFFQQSVLFALTFLLYMQPWKLWCGTSPDIFGVENHHSLCQAFQKIALWLDDLDIETPTAVSFVTYCTKLLHFGDSISGVWSWNTVEVQRLCPFWVSAKCLIHGGPKYLLNDYQFT